MGYKVLADSPALYEFADDKTRLSVFDALVLPGKITKYEFEDALLIQQQEGTSDIGAFVDGEPVESIKVGGKLFVSDRIKKIFELNKVHAEYFDAFVKINHQLFDQKYYLFNPLIGIDCIDYENSQFEKNYNKWDEVYRVYSFSKLVIIENRITLKESLFFIESPDIIKESNLRLLAYIILINEKVAQDLSDSNIRGLNVFDVDKYRYDWKWKDI